MIVMESLSSSVSYLFGLLVVNILEICPNKDSNAAKISTKIAQVQRKSLQLSNMIAGYLIENLSIISTQLSEWSVLLEPLSIFLSDPSLFVDPSHDISSLALFHFQLQVFDYRKSLVSIIYCDFYRRNCAEIVMIMFAMVLIGDQSSLGCSISTIKFVESP